MRNAIIGAALAAMAVTGIGCSHEKTVVRKESVTAVPAPATVERTTTIQSAPAVTTERRTTTQSLESE